MMFLYYAFSQNSKYFYILWGNVGGGHHPLIHIIYFYVPLKGTRKMHGLCVWVVVLRPKNSVLNMVWALTELLKLFPAATCHTAFRDLSVCPDSYLYDPYFHFCYGLALETFNSSKLGWTMVRVGNKTLANKKGPVHPPKHQPLSMSQWC